MEPFLSRLSVQVAPRARAVHWKCRVPAHSKHIIPSLRPFTTCRISWLPKERELFDTKSAPDSHYSKPAADLSQHVSREEKNHFARVEESSKQMQTRSPWMREGSDVPPVSRYRSAGAMIKGKLLTTPSRMLKLVLPLTTRDTNEDRKNIEPLALLVHPQQPLSYLERLIQSELPFMWDEKKGRERAPEINFRAQDSMEDSVGNRENIDDGDMESGDELMVDGKVEKTGRSGTENPPDAKDEEKSVTAMKERKGEQDPKHLDFVRWSPSTEIGDFIRDAARGKEFAVDIEGAPGPIYVGVPSFGDRTYYLRMRLRKVSRRIAQMANIKTDCDKLAHQGAKQVARLGFGGLIGWWGAVYYLTFQTDLGWDVMEPVTYLVGLTGLIGGYMWFLYHNREVSYKNAMHVTVSKRQDQLYKLKGFALPKWEMLIEEGNRLRREVKLIAEEYDVDWDETKDEGDEKVREALRKERKKENKKDDEDDDKDEKDDD